MLRIPSGRALSLGFVPLLFAGLAHAATTTYEVEGFPVKTTGGAISGGWNLWANGYVEATVNFATAGSHDFQIVAKGSLLANVGPQMELRIDGAVAGSRAVPGTGFQTYTLKGNIAAPGNHRIAIAFTNDGKSATEDRNLYLDKLTIVSPVASPSAGCPSSGFSRLVQVNSTSSLNAALGGAQPGDQIRMADGTYGAIKIARSGTAAARIQLCGTKAAVISSGNLNGSIGIELAANYWTISGIKISNSSKGIHAIRSSNNLIDNVEISNIGTEGIHFLVFSSGNTIQNCSIHDTGMATAEWGEGVYIGTDAGQLAAKTGGAPDTSNANKILNNRIGPNVRAEAIDIKEGSVGGLISGNRLDGRGQVRSQTWVESLLELKGSGYQVTNNTVIATILYGIDVRNKADGGDNNTFSGNVLDLSLVPGGQGIYIDTVGATGNVMKCSNQVIPAGAKLSNQACVP